MCAESQYEGTSRAGRVYSAWEGSVLGNAEKNDVAKESNSGFWMKSQQRENGEGVLEQSYFQRDTRRSSQGKGR